ncbi:hypothetical protein ATR01nite_19820 [Acetobacter tropicalis]|uniref:Uncharacterized protein n=1 Tax=Acetobacter tropicalis TaxID=104102 RepID=A0A511FPN3_9PROT|nr:hypothetical protein ATR01nite_19820 [Acetobacter tropicalis]
MPHTLRASASGLFCGPEVTEIIEKNPTCLIVRKSGVLLAGLSKQGADNVCDICFAGL